MFGPTLCGHATAADDRARRVLTIQPKALQLGGMFGYKKTHNDVIPPRENKLYTVSGFVRKVKLSDDDCDFHLELAPSGTATTNWIIVEVGANNKTLQKRVADMFNLNDDVQSHRYNGAKAKKVTVTGYAFLDLSHQCKTWPSKGCNHGGKEVMTLWELHPIYRIEWAQ